MNQPASIHRFTIPIKGFQRSSVPHGIGMERVVSSAESKVRNSCLRRQTNPVAVVTRESITTPDRYKNPDCSFTLSVDEAATAISGLCHPELCRFKGYPKTATEHSFNQSVSSSVPRGPAIG